MGISDLPSVANGSIPLNGSVENITQMALSQTADVLFSAIFTRIVWAFVILIISLVIGKILEKFLFRILSEFKINDGAQKILKAPVKLDEFISNIVGKVIYLIGVIVALNTLNLTGIFLNTISVILMVLIVILLVLGLKDFIPNCFAGLIMHAKRSIHVGDKICLDRICGKVIAFELLQTRLQTKSGDLIHIPNVYFFSRKIKISSTKKK